MITFLLNVRQPFRMLLVVLYVGFIMTLSLIPPQDLPKVQLFAGVDKVVHFMMYLIFSVLFCWALRTEMNPFRLLIVASVAVGWGIFMEYMQLDMHLGRSFSWYDILANCIGVTVGILGYVIVFRKRVA